VKDVARAYVRSAERLLEQLERGVTGVEKYEISSEQDMSVIQVANIVREVSREVRGTHVEVELVNNPRGGETMVEEFGVDISMATQRLGWYPDESVTGTVKRLLGQKGDS
jgi:UDP-glucose 4-epimerase